MTDDHEPPLEGSAAQGRELVYWIAKAAERLRIDANVSRGMIAGLAGVEPITIKRFEDVITFPKDNLDRIMVAYAMAAGLSDERDIYDQGLELWRQHHSSALERLSASHEPVRASQRILREVQQTAARQARKRAAAGSERKSTSTRTRRAAR